MSRNGYEEKLNKGLRGRRPHKVSAPRAGPTPQLGTTTNDNDQQPLQSPTSPRTCPYPAYLMQKPLPDLNKKLSSGKFLHGASQVGDTPVGRMSGRNRRSFPPSGPSSPMLKCLRECLLLSLGLNLKRLPPTLFSTKALPPDPVPGNNSRSFMPREQKVIYLTSPFLYRLKHRSDC